MTEEFIFLGITGTLWDWVGVFVVIVVIIMIAIAAYGESKGADHQ